MKSDKRIKEIISKEINDITPDVFPEILRKIDEQKDFQPFIATNIKNNKNIILKNYFIRVGASVAIFLLLMFGVNFGYGYFKADVSVSLDINPSIELKINKFEKVLSAKPLNSKAFDILETVDLKNKNINEALDMLINSIFSNGYLNKNGNVILLSIETNDSKKNNELQQKLSSTVNDSLNVVSIKSTIVSQTLQQDKRLDNLAQKYNISFGKAVLIDSLVNKNNKLSFDELSLFPISDIYLLVSEKNKDLDTLSVSGEDILTSYIKKETALEKCLEDAEIPLSALISTNIEVDYNYKKLVYKVNFVAGIFDYTYYVDMKNGMILGNDLKRNAPYLSASDIKIIALNHANLTEDSVTFSEVIIVENKNLSLYSVKFHNNDISYSYKINALTGEVMEHKYENITKPSDNHHQEKVFKTEKNIISISEAESIATAHAGTNTKNAREFEVEFDEEKNIYTVEFVFYNIEYEYKIDASSGDILYWEKTNDD